MKAVIPCAKKKESLFPFSESKPTALMPVAGKPVVKHLVKSLQAVGVDDIYLVTNYMEAEFEEEFGSITNVNLVHQEELSGTAKAVSECSFLEEDFLVVNGDVLVSENDLGSLIEKFEETETDTVMVATGEDQPEKFGVLSIENDRIKSIKEKPEEADNILVNTGIYAFSPRVFKLIEQSGSGDLTEALESLIKDGARFELVEDYWIDIGSPRKLWKADMIKRGELVEDAGVHEDAEIHESVEITDEAVVEKGAELKPGTVLEGDCLVGENATVGPGTVLRNSTVGKNCQVRKASVTETLLFEDCILDEHVAVEHSILGEETDIKPGTAIRESFIGARSFIEMNNSIYGASFVPDARTDLGEISK